MDVPAKRLKAKTSFLGWLQMPRR